MEPGAIGKHGRQHVAQEPAGGAFHDAGGLSAVERPRVALIAELAVSRQWAAARAGQDAQQRMPVGAHALGRCAALPGELLQPVEGLSARPIRQVGGLNGEIRVALAALVDIPNRALLLDPPAEAEGAGVDGVLEEVGDVARVPAGVPLVALLTRSEQRIVLGSEEPADFAGVQALVEPAREIRHQRRVCRVLGRHTLDARALAQSGAGYLDYLRGVAEWWRADEERLTLGTRENPTPERIADVFHVAP